MGFAWLRIERPEVLAEEETEPSCEDNKEAEKQIFAIHTTTYPICSGEPVSFPEKT